VRGRGRPDALRPALHVCPGAVLAEVTRTATPCSRAGRRWPRWTRRSTDSRIRPWIGRSPGTLARAAGSAARASGLRPRSAAAVERVPRSVRDECRAAVIGPRHAGDSQRLERPPTCYVSLPAAADRGSGWARIAFGDMVRSCLVGDLAVAAAYAMLGKPDPVAAAASIVRGYHRILPLAEDEMRSSTTSSASGCA